MAFDVKAARSAGYTDDEIAGYLADSSKFDLNAARSAGYTPSEIVDFLSAQAASPAPAPASVQAVPATVAQQQEQDLYRPAGVLRRDITAPAAQSAATVRPGREAVPDMSVGSVAQDALSGALQIGPVAVKGVADLARLATGDRVGKDTSDYLERGMQSIRDTVGSERAAVQRRNFDRDMADPNVSIGQALSENKGALADQILPTVGSMILPVGAAGVAGKVATAGRAAQVARAIDEGTVLARADAARRAAVVGTTVAQNAADTYTDIRDKGGDQASAYTGAAITAPFTAVAGKLTGGAAETQVARMLSGTATRELAEKGLMAIPAAAIREGAQEVGEEAGQYLGESVGIGTPLDANTAGKRLAVAGTLGAVVGGGVSGIDVTSSAIRQRQEQSLQAIGSASSVDEAIAAAADSVATPAVPSTPAQASGEVVGVDQAIEQVAADTAAPTQPATTQQLIDRIRELEAAQEQATPSQQPEPANATGNGPVAGNQVAEAQPTSVTAGGETNAVIPEQRTADVSTERVEPVREGVRAADATPDAQPSLTGADPAVLLQVARDPTNPLQQSAATELRRRETEYLYQQRAETEATQRQAEERALLDEAADQQIAQTSAIQSASEAVAPTAMQEAFANARPLRARQAAQTAAPSSARGSTERSSTTTQQSSASRAPAFTAKVEPVGTLRITGNVQQIRQQLADFGVDKFIPARGGVVVAKSQAVMARRALGTAIGLSERALFSAVDLPQQGYIDGAPYSPESVSLTDPQKRMITSKFNELAAHKKVPDGKSGLVEDSSDIYAKSMAFQELAKQEGYDVISSDQRGKYIRLRKGDITIPVRISDHSNVNRGAHFRESAINIAPDDGYAFDTFGSALWKLRNAGLDDGGNLTFGGEEPLYFSASVVPLGNDGTNTTASRATVELPVTGSQGNIAGFRAASAEHAAAARQLADRPQLRIPGLSFRAVDPAPGNAGQEMSAARLVAKRLFRRDVVFVKFDGKPLFNGVVSSAIPGKVFINAESTKPHMAVLGHELLHEMRADNPRLYDSLSKALDSIIRDDSKYSSDLAARYEALGLTLPKEWREELHADIVGDHFTDPQFWQDLAAEQPTLFQRVAQSIRQFLNRVLAKARPFGTDRFLSDVDAARQAVTSAMRDFSQDQVSSVGRNVDGVVSTSQPAETPPSVTETPAFRRWFGDSKVVNPDGSPMVVYHGTGADITAFDPRKRGSMTREVDARRGFFLSSSPDIAAEYAEEAGERGAANIIPAYVSLQNPLMLDESGRDYDPDRFLEYIERAEEAGYDGVILRNSADGMKRGGPSGDTVIAFEPQQIKSATGNNGSFDRNNPDIRFSASSQESIGPSNTDEVKPSAQQMRAWQLGLKHRASLDGESPSPYFYEELPSSELDFIAHIEERAPVSRAFYESAVRGADMPIRATGTRYGKAPDSGVSRNHVDDSSELGVSMANVPGLEYQWYPMQVVGDSTQYDGWLLDPEYFWGSDGEPLMVGLSPSKVAAQGVGDAQDVRFSAADLSQPAEWQLPEMTRTDRFIYETQDGRIDLKRTQEAIRAAGREIEERFDARTAETLYAGRVAYRAEQFLKADVKPLLQAMTLSKVGMDELADYLHARGAEERNAQIAKVNPELPDGGAGMNSKGVLMTNDAAREYLAAVPKEKRAVLGALAKRVDAITKGTRELLVDEGLEKREVVDAWEATYKNYVPMFRDEAEGGSPAGSGGGGFNVRGANSQRATGSTKQVTNILAHVLMQREAAITRAEKNRVGMALYGLALTNPNRDVWTTIRPGMQAAQIAADLEAMGVDPAVAEMGMSGAPTVRGIDPVTNKVVDRPNPMYKNLPGAIILKVAGEDRVLMLNEKNERALRMAQSLKNLDGLTNFDLAGSIVGRTTRWLAAVNTQFNPAFGLVNGIRDTFGGAINLTSTPLKGKSAKVLMDAYVHAGLGIARSLKGDNSSEWAKLYEQFQEDGGQTGYREAFRTAEDRTKAIEKEMLQLSDSGRMTAMKAVTFIPRLLDGFNTTIENAVRLSAYKNALDGGMSRPAAAKLARELTVDFNRKGRLGREVGPLYAFFNASVQGSARTIEALKGPTGAKIIAGGLALGVAQAIMLAMAGYEEDEVPDFIKSRAFIIPVPGKEKNYIAIPLPLGLHVLPNTGRVIIDLALSGGKDAGKKSFNAVGEIAGAFSPLGGGNIFTADGALRTALPTIIDPVVEIGFNKNFAGGQISKEPRGESDVRPGFARVKESTQRSVTGQAYIGISKALNSVSGGTEYEAGLASPTPEQVQYIAQVAGGGLLREIEKSINLSGAAARGDKVPQSKIPVLGRLWGEVDNDVVDKSRYFESSKAILKAKAAERAAAKAGDADAVQKLYADRPELKAAYTQDQISRAIANLNRLAVSPANDPEQLRQLDEARLLQMRSLNKVIKTIEDSEGKDTPRKKLRRLVSKEPQESETP